METRHEQKQAADAEVSLSEAKLPETPSTVRGGLGIYAAYLLALGSVALFARHAERGLQEGAPEATPAAAVASFNEDRFGYVQVEGDLSLLGTTTQSTTENYVSHAGTASVPGSRPVFAYLLEDETGEMLVTSELPLPTGQVTVSGKRHESADHLPNLNALGRTDQVFLHADLYAPSTEGAPSWESAQSSILNVATP